ncbi:myo-inosose-2 dehydratase [Niveispirillum sp.]|uniref:myo-inosose-2 dehydratase n=1 Tax=Niveispirillum sp. TaxID=1917217 RepID=UPI001B65EBE5|nr:myo-inosose-2 dehydratase [Niveispirillum sp.]MBP7334896.1 myo-inosose-2 dehydratase [Niveispirillum sp.]
MSIRFGVSPIAWINDDMPELGGDTPLSTVLSDTAEIGFTGIELGGRFPRDPAALRDLLGSYDLNLVGGWYSGNLLVQDADTEIAALQPHLALLKALGTDVFVFAETSNAIHCRKEIPLNDTPSLNEAEWVQFGARLTAVSDYLKGQGMRMAYHHHLGTVVERPADLDAFLRHTGPSVGLTVDTGHAVLGGVDPLALLRDHPERVAHVHCKDYRGDVFARVRETGMSFLEGVLAGMFTVPGDGGINFGAVMRTLADIGYSGWVIVEAEQDPAIAPPADYGRIGIRTLTEAATAAGLTVVGRGS